jgi:glutathione S-transferase
VLLPQGRPAHDPDLARPDRAACETITPVMTQLRIHRFPISTWTRTACMTCVEKGIDYELVPIAYGGPEHAAMHPFSRIPVLEHDGRIVTEGLAVMGYLDEAFDGPALQPADLESRTRMREWMSRCGDYVFREVVRLVPRNRPPTEEELATARAVLERIDGLVGSGPFLVPQVSNAKEKAPELLASLGALSGWYAGIVERESFRLTSYDAAAL